MAEDTLEKARRIKADLGHYELEVTCGGERDLHRYLLLCKKNKGHKEFIPVNKFNKANLPPPLRDDDLVGLITAEAELTVRVSVEHISKSRPKCVPGSSKTFPLYSHSFGNGGMATGTGRVHSIYMYLEQDKKPCECEECAGSDEGTTTKAWGEVVIDTAAHVVYDQSEAKHTSCYLIYKDSQAKMDIRRTLRGLNVVVSEAKRDWCRLRYVTHDMELLETLKEKRKCCNDLCSKVLDKFGIKDNDGQSSANTMSLNNPEHNLAICVSHPHGCSKQISVGKWTDRQVVEKGKFGQYRNNTEYDGELTWYTYDTPTCPGSSGAYVFSPVRRCVRGEGWECWVGLFHTHVQGAESENINCSSEKWEAVQGPT